MFRTIALLAFLALNSFGQNTTAQLTGTVTDSSGAALPGAKVTVTNAGTGAVRESASNPSGNYAVPLLEPGTYHLRIEKEGFGAVIREGLTLHVDQVARIDIQLQPGAVKETVFVTADAPLLQEAEASLGTVIENRNIIEMPLNGRNPFDLVFLVPGAVQHDRLDLPGNMIALSNMSINGAPSMSNEVLLDGIPNTSPQHGQYAMTPSIDSVQEFKVQTNNMSAEFGRTAGGVINVTMKAGANQLHGVFYEFLRNRALDANNWINKRTGTDRPKFVYNQAGGNVGGPIRRNKAFFFGNYEAMRRRLGKPFLFSIPSLEMRQGDFSKLANQRGQSVAIYDPITTRPQAAGSATNVRDPFPNNVIPVSRFDKVSANLLKYYPAPNLAGEKYTYQNNFISSVSERYNVDQIHTRLDYNFSPRFQSFGRFSWNSSNIIPPNVFDSIFNPASGPQIFTQRNVGLSGAYSIRPSTFAGFRLGYLRYRDHSEPLGMGFDLTQAGFPAYLRDTLPMRTPPTINITGYQVSNIGFGATSLGPVNGALLNNITNTYSGLVDVTHIRGAHVVKAGHEARVFRISGFRPPLPTFNFNKAMTQGPNPNNAVDTVGNAVASFLLGTGNGGNVQLRANQDVQTWYMGAFVQDDYKVLRTLTLNLGARMEYEAPRTDRYDRLNWLDLASPSGLTVAGVGPLRGGLQFVGVKGHPRGQMDLGAFVSPRFGFAWQARRNTAVRGGYGIFLSPRYGGEFNGYGQIGFQATTTYVASINSITPNAFLSNPFPNGFIQPTGSSQGLLTNIGADATSWERGSRAPYVQQWNFNVQRSLWSNLVVEVAYAGSKGTHLPQTLEFNQLPEQYMSLGSELQRSVANPFFGIIPASQSVGGANTTVAQLLRPYPQFTNVTSTYATAGSSIYHSLQVRVQKRLSRGATFLASYTNGKLIDDGSPGRLSFFGNVPSFQNSNNRRLERAISSQEVSQRLSANYTLMLPFGKGQHFLTDGKGLLAALVGGWQLNGIHAFQTGRPITITNSSNNANAFSSLQRPNSTGMSAALEGPVRNRIDRYFDVSQFTQPAAFTFGNVGRSLPDVRTPGVITFDLSASRNIRVTERMRLQFRAEAFNAINWTNFGRPASVFGNADFGTIRSAQDMRIAQLGLKLYY
jgi:hypothetical protein